MEYNNDELVIVESELDRRRELDRRLSESSNQLTAASHVLTLSTFFSRMIDRSPIPPAAPNWLRNVAMRKAAGLDPDAGEPELISGSARPARLIHRLLRIRYELGMACISRDEISEAVEQWKEDPSPLHLRLPAVIEHYRSLLKQEQVRDRPGQLEMLASIADERSQLPGPYEHVRYIDVSGLDHLRELEFRLLSNLLQNVEQASVEFSYNPEREEAFSWVLPTLKQFERAGLTLNTVDPAFRIPEESPGNALSKVRERIFREPEQLVELDPIPPDDSLKFVETDDPDSECRTVASLVRRTLENGITPSDIAVVVRQGGTRKSQFRNELEAVDVPCLCRESGFSSFDPGIQTLLHPIRTVFDGYQREDVLELMRNDLLGGPAEIDVSGLDNVLREAGVTGGSPETWRSRLNETDRAIRRRLDAYESSSPDTSFFSLTEEHERKINHDLNRILDRLEPLFDVLSDAGDVNTLSGIVSYLQEGMPTFDIPSSLAHSNLETEVGFRILRSVSAFRSFLDELRTGLRSVDLQCEFRNKRDPLNFLKQIWEDAESNRMEWNGPSDGVRILTPAEMSGTRYRRVFMTGMNEGQWPKAVYDDPFLTDDLIIELRRTSGSHVLRTSSRKRSRELYYFHQVLSAAEERTVFTWSRMDAEGTEQLPSPFLEDVKKLLSDVHVRNADSTNREEEGKDRLFSDRERLIRITSGNSSTISSSSSNTSGNPDNPFHPRIRHVLERQRLENQRDRFFLEPDPERRTEKAGPWSGVLSEPDRLRTLLTERMDGFRTEKWSATALERYAQCPYAYFSERILEVEDQERPTLGMNRRREGLLLHEIMRRLYDENEADGAELDDGAIDRICEDVFDRWEYYGFQGDPTFWQVKRERIKIRIHRVVKYLERNRTEKTEIRTEKSFGTGQPLPSLQLNGKDGSSIVLEGRIDRIEIDGETNGAVLDYKNARNRQKYRDYIKPEEFGKRSFQIPTYLLAAAEVREEPYSDVSSWKAGFLTLREYRREPEVSDTFFASEDETLTIEELRERLLDGSTRIVERIMDGNFEVTPDPCLSGCPYRSMCRYEKRTSDS